MEEEHKTRSQQEQRKLLREQAKTLLVGLAMRNPGFSHDVYINVKGIKEWLNQPHCLYTQKNKALLSLPTLFAAAIYLGDTPDPKQREYVRGCHIFKTALGEEPSWIVVHENVWGEFLVHSISDNLPILDKKQDF